MIRRSIIGLSIVTAALFATVREAPAQSAILDTSAPVRFNLTTKLLAWPTSGFWETNQVVQGVYGTAALSAGRVTVTNAAISSTDVVLGSWASTGKVGVIITTVASGTVTFASSATNDQTGNINWLSIGR